MRQCARHSRFCSTLAITDSAVGKTLTIKLLKKSAFALYNNKFEPKNLSTVTDINSVELAKGDLVAFIGKGGDTFEISLNSCTTDKCQI